MPMILELLPVLRESEIPGIWLLDSIRLRGWGNCLVFRVESNASQIVPKYFHILYSLDKDMQSLIMMDTLYFFKVRERDEVYDLGGVRKFRGKGFFYVLNAIDSKMKIVFNTLELSNDSIRYHVFNRSLDCVRFRDEYLAFECRDINRDGYNDFAFSGTEQHFCNGYASRQDGELPIRENLITYSFVYTGNDTTASWVIGK